MTQRSRGRFSMIYSASFESELWLRNRNGKNVSYRMQKWRENSLKKAKFPFQYWKITNVSRFLMIRSPDYAVPIITPRSECEWCILILYCSREKLFPQWMFCYCTIPLFLQRAYMLRNFTRVKSCVDSFLDPTCVPVSINKFTPC